ncbi:MAG TPA: acyltransferase family protein [Anaerolineales bacterium]|nr:acyltransferase family protein [Anaerolineales bacterium]
MSLVNCGVAPYTFYDILPIKSIAPYEVLLMIQESPSIELSKPITHTIALVKRIDYVDIAKGIGIVLVVMGHNDFALISVFAHKLIYSFHMPMFFFMSGMFLRPDVPFWSFLRSRFSRVLKPYMAILILIYLASTSFSKVSLVMATRRLLKAMYANGHYLDWVQLWFLPHLFAVSLFAFVFFKVMKRTPLYKWRYLILGVLYTVGVRSLKFFWPFDVNLMGRSFVLYGLPFSIDLVPVSGFFFIFGYELNRKQNDTLLENPKMLWISGIMLALLVWYFPQRIDFNTRQFDSLAINTAEALLGIYFILTLSKQFERIAWLSSIFKYIGQASLIILIFQVPIQDYWGQKILVLTNNLQFSYWISFLIGIVGPIVINILFIRPNQILREWFNQPAPQESKRSAVSVFE